MGKQQARFDRKESSQACGRKLRGDDLSTILLGRGQLSCHTLPVRARAEQAIGALRYGAQT